MIPASSVKTNHIFCLGMSKSISVSIHSVIGPNADPQNPILAKFVLSPNRVQPIYTSGKLLLKRATRNFLFIDRSFEIIE